jgi:hypothetical protein
MARTLFNSKNEVVVGGAIYNVLTGLLEPVDA